MVASIRIHLNRWSGLPDLGNASPSTTDYPCCSKIPRANDPNNRGLELFSIKEAMGVLGQTFYFSQLGVSIIIIENR